MMLIGAPSLRASNNTYPMLTESILIAPVIEEIAKDVALFGIYRWGRFEFDNALDGLVYGAMVGFGFAMTENIFYFVGAFEQGGFPSLTFVIFIRNLPALWHESRTLFRNDRNRIGLARNTNHRTQRVWFIILGLVAAIVAHALHNFGVALTALNPLNLVFSVALATVGLGALVIAIWLNWQKGRRILRTELASEIGQTLTQSEFENLLQSRHIPFRRLRGKGRQRAAQTKSSLRRISFSQTSQSSTRFSRRTRSAKSNRPVTSNAARGVLISVPRKPVVIMNDPSSS